MNGRTEYYTDYTNHYNSGGYDGPSGYHGHTPNTPLYDGSDGVSGRVEIVADGSKRLQMSMTYARRYNLLLSEFVLTEEEGDNADGIFEFGEIANMTGFLFLNCGGMPTPEQRIRVTQVRFYAMRCDARRCYAMLCDAMLFLC